MVKNASGGKSNTRIRKREKNSCGTNNKKNNTEDDGEKDDNWSENHFCEQLSEDHTIAESMSSAVMIDDIDNDYENNEDDGQGNYSVHDHMTINSNWIKLRDTIRMTSTLPTEKRSSKREMILKSLFRSITQYAVEESGRGIVCASAGSVIIPACISSAWKKAGSTVSSSSMSEQYAACRILEAIAIIVSGEQIFHDEDDSGDAANNCNDDAENGSATEYFELIERILRKIVLSPGRAYLVRGAALRAISLSYFMSSPNSKEKLRLLDLCEQVAAAMFRGVDVHPTLRAIALDCWTLLSTTLPNSMISGDEALTTDSDEDENEELEEKEDVVDCDDINYSTKGEQIFTGGRGVQILPLLNECLNHENIDLRASAGECVALIHEIRLEMGVQQNNSNNEDFRNASDRRYGKGSWSSSEGETIMEEIKQRVSELSIESGHRLSKKVKKKQRATFREYSRTINEDEAPSEVVSFRGGGQITLTSWKQIVRLSFIRRCLQSGFQIQLMTNVSLQNIFRVSSEEINAVTSFDPIEKRLNMSKSSEKSKAADLSLTKKRRAKTNAKNYFLTADGGDI